LKELQYVWSRHVVQFEDGCRCAGFALFWGGRTSAVAPADIPRRHEASLPDVRASDPDALAKTPDLLLGDTRQDVRDQIGDFTPLVDGVHGDAESFQFFPAANPLQETATQAIEHRDHHDHRHPLASKRADVGKKPLVPWAVVSGASQDVLILGAQGTAVPHGVLPAVGELRIERDAVASLFVAADSGVNEGDGERRTTRRVFAGYTCHCRPSPSTCWSVVPQAVPPVLGLLGVE
jgi:hypothetical protein